MAQVDATNVLAVRNQLRFQAEEMQQALREAAHCFPVKPCGRDVVSLDAATLFDEKVQHLVEIHVAHLNEVVEAAERLHEAALQYGYTEDSIQTSFKNAHPGMQERLEGFRAMPPGRDRLAER